MRRLISLSLLVGVCIALPSLEVHAQKKKGNAQGAPAVALDSDKLGVREIVGTLRSVPGSDRKFNLEVQVPAGTGAGYGGKGGNANRIAQLQVQLEQAQLQLLTARTSQQRQQALNRITSLQRQAQQVATGGNRGGKGGKGNMVKREIEFQAAENVKVRTMLLPNQFDEKGNPKKFTKEELAALKGKDKTSPGYESSLEQLENGQPVRLVLAAAPAKKPADDKEKDKDKDKDDPVAADKRMQVKLIVVLGEATAAGPAPKGKKK
jgi:hypothetical protein